MKTKTIGEMTFETNLLIERLVQMQEDEIATYAALSDVVSTNVQVQPGRRWLESARKYCEREFKMKFGTVWKVGVKRLDANGWIIEDTVRANRGLHNKARRHHKSLGRLSQTNLTNEQRVVVAQAQANYGAILSITEAVKTRPTAPRKVADSARISQHLLPGNEHLSTQ